MTEDNPLINQIIFKYWGDSYLGWRWKKCQKFLQNVKPQVCSLRSQLECWNTGIMGFWDAGAMGYWKNVSDKNIKNRKPPLKNIIPIF
jgi:hypothetical protein